MYDRLGSWLQVVVSGLFYGLEGLESKAYLLSPPDPASRILGEVDLGAFVPTSRQPGV